MANLIFEYNHVHVWLAVWQRTMKTVTRKNVCGQWFCNRFDFCTRETRSFPLPFSTAILRNKRIDRSGHAFMTTEWQRMGWNEDRTVRNWVFPPIKCKIDLCLLNKLQTDYNRWAGILEDSFASVNVCLLNYDDWKCECVSIAKRNR